MDERDDGDEPRHTMARSHPPPSKERTHGADGKFIRTTETAERDAEAADLFSRGMSYVKIAERLGYADHTGAMKAVERALDAVTRPSGERAQKLHLQRLQAIRAEANAMADEARALVGGDYLAYNTKGVVEWDGEPLADITPKLAAIDRVLSSQRMIIAADEREAKLLGLDAPTKAQVAVEDATYRVLGVGDADLGEPAAG